MRHSTRRVNGIRLHIAESGPEGGPLAILLHGFPDFWRGWKNQAEPLAQAGLRVVAPDMRGYNLSGKPRGLTPYRLRDLSRDVIALADSLGASRFLLAGHDWGGVVAWEVAARFPERVERLAILNAPHPDVWLRVIRRRPSQALRSSYAALFQIPRLPEMLLSARDFASLKRTLRRSARQGIWSDEELDLYAQAWRQPGALTSMLNYYRALRLKPRRGPATIRPRTLLIWGARDAFLEREVALASLKLCERGEPMFLESAGHWVQLEEPQAVSEALIRFFQAD